MCRYSWLLFPFKMLSMQNSKVSKCHMETFLQGRVSTWHLPFLCLLLFTVQISTRVCSHSSALFLFLNGPRPLQRMCFMNRFHNVHFVSLKDESRLLLTRQTWQWINVLHFTVWLQLYLQTFFFFSWAVSTWKINPSVIQENPPKIDVSPSTLYHDGTAVTWFPVSIPPITDTDLMELLAYKLPNVILSRINNKVNRTERVSDALLTKC